MKPGLSMIRKGALRISHLLLPPILCLVVGSALLMQFLVESASWTEVLPLTSFVVLLTFSALALNWSRGPIPAESATPVHRAGVDLFIASLLALVSAFLAWLPATPQLAGSSLLRPIFALHWFFLLLAAVIFLAAILDLLAAARRGAP